MESHSPVYKRGNGESRFESIELPTRGRCAPSPRLRGEGWGEGCLGRDGESWTRGESPLPGFRPAREFDLPPQAGRGEEPRPYVNNVGCCRDARSCASTTATAVMLRMPRAVTDGVRMWAGRAGPIRIGPTGSASASDLIIW